VKKEAEEAKARAEEAARALEKAAQEQPSQEVQ
jgi:hypothetical protein